MLKSFLSLLLSKFYSKEESGLVAHQAMPSSKSVSLTPSKTEVTNSDGAIEKILDYYAPCDGYIKVSGTSTSTNPRIFLNTYAEFIYNSYGNSITNAINTPVSKGIKVEVRVNYLKEIKILFQKSMGG